MRIIEKGVFWGVECKNCHSKLEAEVSDVRQGTFGGNAWENGETRQYVECPVCREHLLLPRNKEIPYSLLSRT